jgi:hypothetical protein
MESRLLKLNNLIHDRYDIHGLIHSNIRLNVAPYEQKYTNKYNKGIVRKTGRLISEYISKINSRKLDLDGELSYINTLRTQLSREVAHRIEPRLAYIEDQYKTGQWVKLTYISYVESASRNDRFELINTLHNVHESTADPLLIAYYPSIDHMRKGREVRTKLGKYLKTYQIELGLGDADIKSIVEKHNAMIEARAGWTVKFIGSNDPKGWHNVYANCTIRSCMSDHKGEAEEAISLYAHDQSVLRLAFIQSGDEIIARAIVRDDLKQYIRIYPESQCRAEGTFLKSYLKNLGYEHGSLEGVLIRTFHHDDGGYCCPYIDRGTMRDYPEGEIVKDDGRLYIRIVENGDIKVTLTNGRTEEHEEYECECCGEYYHEDDMDGDVCTNCRDEYTLALGRNRNHTWIDNNDVIWVGDEAYDPEWLCENDIYYDEYNDEYYHLDDLVNTSRGLVHHDDCTLLDHEDAEGNSHAVDVDTKELSNGKICHKDDAESLEAELSESEATSE